MPRCDPVDVTVFGKLARDYQCTLAITRIPELQCERRVVGIARPALGVELDRRVRVPGFGHALAQLIGYGSDLRQLAVEEFDRGVVQRCLANDRVDARPRGSQLQTGDNRCLSVGFSHHPALGGVSCGAADGLPGRPVLVHLVARQPRASQ